MRPGKETFVVCAKCWDIIGLSFEDTIKHIASHKDPTWAELVTVVGPPGFPHNLRRVPRPLRPVVIWLLGEHDVLRYDYAFVAFADDRPPATSLPEALALSLIHI